MCDVMAKYWEIRESYGDKMPMDDMSEKEKKAYECGYEEGYEAAMDEMSDDSDMGERYGRRGGYMGDRMGNRGSIGDRGYMGERRRRRY